MRRWYLVPLMLICLLALGGVAACSSSQGPGAEVTTTVAQADATTTTAIPTTTTTLAPAAWQALAPKGELPPARLGGSLLYLAGSNRLLLFGGWAGGSEYYSAIWSYDLTTDAWSKLEPTGTSPSARAAQAAAYDPTADNLVVFGGYDGSTYLGDTWVYDFSGNAWTALAPTAVSPAARQGHSLVYEPVSQKMILFGGFDGSRQYNDTWSYDPATQAWKDLKPGGTLPAARDSQALAYDPDNKVLILFGGWSTTTQYDDTWAYDPAENSWAALQTAGQAPSARALAQLVYDPAIKQMVLFGGGTSSATFNDAWLFEYAARSWTPAATTGDLPSMRAGHGLVYDTSANDILLFGGSNGIGTYLDDLWRLHR